MISVANPIKVLGETNTHAVQLFQKTGEEEIVPNSFEQ